MSINEYPNCKNLIISVLKSCKFSGLKEARKQFLINVLLCSPDKFLLNRKISQMNEFNCLITITPWFVQHRWRMVFSNDKDQFSIRLTIRKEFHRPIQIYGSPQVDTKARSLEVDRWVSSNVLLNTSANLKESPMIE